MQSLHICQPEDVAASAALVDASVVAASAATAGGGLVSCMDLFCMDIDACFALGLVWTIVLTCLHY